MPLSSLGVLAVIGDWKSPDKGLDVVQLSTSIDVEWNYIVDMTRLLPNVS